MTSSKTYRLLTASEIKALTEQGCTVEAGNWSNVQVVDGFDAARVRNVQFAGQVCLGALNGSLRCGAVRKPAGLSNATLVNCTLGDNVLIANVGVHLANYHIGEGARLENLGLMETRAGATFGNGLDIEVLNEGGGREVVLFNELSSQFAYLMCVHRYRPNTIDKLQALARAYAKKIKSDRGIVGAGACVLNVKEMVDVNIGPAAMVNGAGGLINGTILSAANAPTTIGPDVLLDNFIVAEGSLVTSGAILSKCFVGQGCRIGKQFSAENSLFFANCEGFHGEACNLFAGPYSVTHHKSTLLIAALVSFFNAGSGTNQSNHMYKLGPVHEGKLERGSKTGSFSYMMWPCRVGPFSVVLGKHTRNFDTTNFPFSIIEARPDGRCSMVPGLNLSTVGTVRDGAKWPSRDRRQGALKRDRISFEVFSPFTVGRMLTGSAILQKLQETTDKAVDSVAVLGADIKRVLLRTGQKFYRAAIEMYLLEKVVARTEAALKRDVHSISEALANPARAVYSGDWLDIGGQLMPRQRLDDLCVAIENDQITDVLGFHVELDRIAAAYDDDEWVWVKKAYQQVFQVDLDAATPAQVIEAANNLLAGRSKYLRLIVADAAKEFDELSHTGFGQDGTGDTDIKGDFSAVRGECDRNKFVKDMKEQIAVLEQRVAKFKTAIANL